MNKGAIFSDCRKYRYVLVRRWDETKPKAMCIGLNPSTADHEKDDPTIRHLVGALQILGFGGLFMTNLFALISPKPEDLRSCPNPVRENDSYLGYYGDISDTIIFAWGKFPMAHYRAKVIIPRFPDAMCFGKNSDGTPMHPLSMMYNGTIKNPKLLTWRE